MDRVGYAVPATNPNQFKVKAWLSLVAVVGSLVQLATISRVYSWADRVPPGAALPDAAGSVGFPDTFFRTDGARPAAEGAVR